MGKCKGEGVKREDENGRKEGGGGGGARRRDIEGAKEEGQGEGNNHIIYLL